MTQNTVKQVYVTSDRIFKLKQFVQRRMQLAQWRENSKGKYVELQIWQKVTRLEMWMAEVREQGGEMAGADRKFKASSREKKWNRLS